MVEKKQRQKDQLGIEWPKRKDSKQTTDPSCKGMVVA
jgi:hypothetical protein